MNRFSEIPDDYYQYFMTNLVNYLNFDVFFPIRDVLALNAGYYGLPNKEAYERADVMLEQFGLTIPIYLYYPTPVWEPRGGFNLNKELIKIEILNAMEVCRIQIIFIHLSCTIWMILGM